MLDMTKYKKANPCVQCGYCCSVGPCHYGHWENGKCSFLLVDNKEVGTFKCKLYENIKKKEKQSSTPMFDEYCSSSLGNTVRNKVMKK